MAIILGPLSSEDGGTTLLQTLATDREMIPREGALVSGAVRGSTGYRGELLDLVGATEHSTNITQTENIKHFV